MALQVDHNSGIHWRPGAPPSCAEPKLCRELRDWQTYARALERALDAAEAECERLAAVVLADSFAAWGAGG
jgi:hypothetical protein